MKKSNVEVMLDKIVAEASGFTEKAHGGCSDEQRMDLERAFMAGSLSTVTNVIARVESNGFHGRDMRP